MSRQQGSGGAGNSFFTLDDEVVGLKALVSVITKYNRT
jgi:hypothetical protein